MAEHVRVLGARFRAIWRATLRRGRVTSANGRDGACPSNTNWLRLKAALGYGTSVATVFWDTLVEPKIGPSSE